MKNKFLLLGLSLGCFVLLNGCKKDTEPTKFDMLTSSDSKTWKLLAKTDDFGNVQTIKPCEADDTWTFNSSGDLVMGIGISRCHSAEKQETFKFVMSNDVLLTIIYVDGTTTYQEDLTVKELTKDNMVLVDDDGASQTFIPQ